MSRFVDDYRREFELATTALERAERAEENAIARLHEADMRGAPTALKNSLQNDVVEATVKRTKAQRHWKWRRTIFGACVEEMRLNNFRNVYGVDPKPWRYDIETMSLEGVIT